MTEFHRLKDFDGDNASHVQFRSDEMPKISDRIARLKCSA